MTNTPDGIDVRLDAVEEVGLEMWGGTAKMKPQRDKP